jgi:hypothetical protein
MIRSFNSWESPILTKQTGVSKVRYAPEGARRKTKSN